MHLNNRVSFNFLEFALNAHVYQKRDREVLVTVS